MADVASDIKDWSTTASSNSPADATAVGAGLADNLQQIQATVRAAFAYKGADIASATTTDLGAVTGFYHDITGTTTITGFGTVSAGVRKVLQFDGALTLTYNATSMILPGNVDITTAAGDHLEAMSLGSGNWIILWYSKDAAGSAPPFSDAVGLVRDVTDPTKILRVDVGAITTATTRVATAPDYDIRLGNLPAGIGPLPYAGSSVPTGWLECDGSAVSRTTYSALFTAISTTWGTGDGSTTFNLPDMRNRSPIGAGTGTVTETIAAASVDTSADSLAVTANDLKWITGMTVVGTTSGTLPTGLSLATTYYVIRNTSTSIKLASSLANAQNGTAIDITGQGSGNHTFTHTFTAKTLGQYGGEEAHAMSISELVSHRHFLPRDPDEYTSGAGGTDGGKGAANFDTYLTDYAGGNAAMNVMNPFAVVKYIISY